MIESIRFRSVLPFDKGEREGFVSIIWRDVADRWGEDFSSEIEARIQMEIDAFEQIEGYMAYLYFVWRVVIDSNYFIMPYRTLAHASAVCYALGITEVDPIRLGLDFNRFIPTDRPRFAEIGISTNATASQIQTEIMNLDFDEDRERLGERELNGDAPALIIYPSQRTAQLLGYFSEKLEYMPFDDQATFRTLLRSEDLTGVYGYHPGSDLQEYLQQAKPYFEDLIPLCADNLPAHYVFLHRRYNIACKTKFAPEIKSILNETYGGILYDEQVYALAKLVGYTPSEAEQLRRMLVLHKKQEYKTHRCRFSKYKGLFGKLIKDGGWTYPKSHLAEVARLVYTTAYLKTHFPDEFTRAALCVAASEDY